MKDHGLIDQRSLAFDRLTARKLAADPALLGRARQTVDRWLASCSSRVRPVLLEWRGILDRPVSEVIKVMLDESPDGARLRQSSPFAGVLSPAERTAILKEHQRREPVPA